MVSGINMNYLHVGNLILFPIFNKKEDNYALHVIDNLYPKHEIVPIKKTCEIEIHKSGKYLLYPNKDAIV